MGRPFNPFPSTYASPSRSPFEDWRQLWRGDYIKEIHSDMRQNKVSIGCPTRSAGWQPISFSIVPSVLVKYIQSETRNVIREIR